MAADLPFTGTQYPSFVRNPSILSFQTDSTSDVETLSSDNTVTSSSTIWGPGAVTGKALVAFGKATLRGATAIVIQTRLQALKFQFPQTGDDESSTIPKAYRVMLELTSGQTRDLLKYVSEWPLVEITLFLREIMLCIPSKFTSLENYQHQIHIELIRDLKGASPLSIFLSAQFFAQVIVGLADGPQAFIEAEGLEVFLKLHSNSPDGINYIQTDHPEDLALQGYKYVWGDVLDVLSRDPRGAEHRLLDVFRSLNKVNKSLDPQWTRIYPWNVEPLPSLRYRLATFGSPGVNTLALVLQFLQGHLDTDYPNIDDGYKKRCVIDGELADIEILDTTGVEQFSALRNWHMNTRDGFLLIYSVTSRSSFQEIPAIRDRILLINGESTPMILVANNCDDVHEREVDMDEGRELATDFKCPYIETSYSPCSNVDEAFFNLVREIRKYYKSDPWPDARVKRRRDFDRRDFASH